MVLDGTIKVKAMCVFIHDGKVLASPAVEKSKHKHFYRLPGGKIEFGESSVEALHREIQEELGSEIENLRLLDVVENRFEYEGKRGHEIVFVYSGDLARKEAAERVPDERDLRCITAPRRCAQPGVSDRSLEDRDGVLRPVLEPGREVGDDRDRALRREPVGEALHPGEAGAVGRDA